MDLTEAENIEKSWQEYTEERQKKDHDPDNHDGMITHLKLSHLSHQGQISWNVKCCIQ